jgi:hypothetical protein
MEGNGRDLGLLSLPGGTEKNHEKSQSGSLSSGRDLNQGPPGYE